jgi:3-methyl-2-oxobutanoate hydroxymethyltransferase
MKRKTIVSIKNMKNNEKISVLTCYSYFNAKIFDEIGIDIVLIGDSLGNVVMGYDDTLKVEVSDIIYHSRIVARGNKTSLLIGDMPFMSYQVSKEQAIKNAGNIIKYGEVNAVKIEGGIEVSEQVKAIIEVGIPVMGHIGLTPQAVNAFGGYKVQGMSKESQDKILNDAIELEKIGVFAIVLECLPENFAKKITENLKIPTIGIGAGRFCDGQVLVFEDIIGLNFDEKPKKIVKVYKNIGQELKEIAKKYNNDVKNKTFPSENNVFK